MQTILFGIFGCVILLVGWYEVEQYDPASSSNIQIALSQNIADNFFYYSTVGESFYRSSSDEKSGWIESFDRNFGGSSWG